jgi:methylmalonyl-CoA mutase
MRLRDVRKQYQRNHGLWDAHDHMPVFGTTRSSTTCMNRLYRCSAVLKTKPARYVRFEAGNRWKIEKIYIILPHRDATSRDRRSNPPPTTSGCASSQYC